MISLVFNLEETVKNDQKIKFSNLFKDFDFEQLSNIIKNARALDELGQFEEAILWYDLAISKNPRDIVAWYNKGNILDNLGKYEDAIYCYDTVIDIIPNDTSAMYNKATVLARIGKYEEAISLYDKIISIDPTHVGALYNKRRMLDKLGMHYGIMQIKQKQML